MKSELIGILLPSKNRLADLILTLIFTSLKCPKGYEARFYICANYDNWILTIFKLVFKFKANFINEKELEWKGMIGAYNYSYQLAVKDGAQWVILWADDIIPEKHSWLIDLTEYLENVSFEFGIFSSDEGHHQSFFGWNIFGGYPCAHFFIAKTKTLPGYILSPKLSAFCGDNEVVIKRIKEGKTISLIPIRIFHQHTLNPTRSTNINNYEKDLKRLYELHPELTGKLDNVVLRGIVSDENSYFVPDENAAINYSSAISCLPIDNFKKVAYRPKYSYRNNIWNIRKILNKN